MTNEISTIELTPASPLVVSTTTSQTFVSFSVTECCIDLSEGRIELSVEKTDDQGVKHTDKIVLTSISSELSALLVSETKTAVAANYGITL